MQLSLNNLPTDAELLHRLVRDIVGGIEHRDSEIERLKSFIKQLQRMQFGRRSEHLDADQLTLAPEDIDGDIGCIKESRPTIGSNNPDAPPCRNVQRLRRSDRSSAGSIPERNLLKDTPPSAADIDFYRYGRWSQS